MSKLQPLHKLGKLIVACETYIIHNNHVLMQKRPKNAKKFPNFWIGPGGHIDEGEDALTAAIREVQEETGIKIRQKDIKLKVLAFHHHIDRKEIWIEYIFRTTIPHMQKTITTDEGKSEWLNISKLLQMDKVFPPSKHYFDHILNNKPGILYGSSQWKNAKLVKILSEKIDRNN